MTESRDALNKQQLNLELRDVAERDFQLWSIGLLVFAILAIGFVALIAPNLLWKGETLHVDGRYLPQLFSGFIVLVILFNVYMLDQKRRLSQTRDQLLRRLLDETAHQTSLLDPVTHTFSRVYLDQALPRELSRATRQQSQLTLLMAEVGDYAGIKRRYGQLAGDHLLMVLAQTLKSTLRGSDIICRSGEPDFTVIMPETNEATAQFPISRMLRAIDKWNETTKLEYKLKVRLGLSTLKDGYDNDLVLERARKRMAENIYAPSRSGVPMVEDRSPMVANS